MISVRDIYSLTEFQRNAREHIQRLRRTRRPAVLTVNGKAEVVVQDAESYQELLDRMEQMETLLAIQEGLASIDRGEGRPAREVIEAIRARVKTGRTV